MNAEMSMVVKRNEEREALRSIIQQWNANRLDLFELSEPNEHAGVLYSGNKYTVRAVEVVFGETAQDLDFHGVMRFYFQDSGQKVATKCIRVASDATAQNVIETLIEKFRPDMRMLSLPEYALFEIHENGEERRLEMDEKPLLVQLNWHKDDREGRFLLRRIDDKTTNMPPSRSLQDGSGDRSSFRRKLSKREKKQLKKQEKLNRLKSVSGPDEEENTKVAEKLYTELPETSFTRSISNPEVVMRRRRQQKFEEKLQEFRGKDGNPDTGGTLKIYGESLCRDVPYKTLLLSVKDTAQQVVKEMLIKYGLEKEDVHNYCLVQVNSFPENNSSSGHKDGTSNNIAKNIGNNDGTLKNSNTLNNSNTSNQEYILDDDECPLTILMTQKPNQGSIMFHVRRRPADYHPRKRKKKPQQKWNQQASNELLEYRYEDGLDRLPFLLELNPDGSEVAGGAAKRHRLHLNVTEVGCERLNSPGQSQYLQLFGPNIQPRHCVIANTEGIVTVTPCSRDAETYVNNQRIYETTILQNGSIVKFGRIHCFRFLDPCFEDRMRQRHDSVRNINDYVYESRQTTREDTSSITTTETQRISSSQNAGEGPALPHNYETTFDVDGNVETRSTSSQGNRDDTRSQRSIGSSRDGNRLPNAGYPRVGTDPILPAVLEIREETEEALLHALITDLDPLTPSFKLAPAYCLYLMARYRASTHYRPELTPTERAHRLTLMLARVAGIIHAVIQERYCDKKSLALWLANSSELLNFLKSDRHISAFSVDAQDTLADAVQLSFRYMVSCIQSELSSVMPHFFVDKDDPSHDAEDSPIAPVLAVLSSVMGLLRRCRVNAALTIQLFSQLFYFINVWAFNKLIAPNTNYCSRVWGLRLKARLAQIEVWAERQGLELAADCHLARIVQAAHLLQAPKYTTEDLASLTSTCFKLNSLQLRALLTKYNLTPDEPKLPHDLIENVVKVAENLADELARSDCREVKLEEESELALPFLLPEDGYSCEVIRGIPQGLIEFVSPLQHSGLCRLSSQPSSNGSWTVYMGHAVLPGGTMVRSPSAMSNRSGAYQPGQQEPEIQTIKLHKSNNGMGLSIVAAKGAGQDKLGIYIKSVVKGGAADADGRLQAGDQLLKVDGQSLVGITQEKAAEYLVRTGPIVTLEVAKQGAIYHGLATLLSQPSPVLSKAGRRISERDLPSRVQNDSHNHTNPQIPMHPSQIHSSKSVPTLNSTGISDNQVVSPALGSRSSHEVFNPGYSRTSSTNSIHQRLTEQQMPHHHAAHRSRSTQNLNDSRSMTNYPAFSHMTLSRLPPSFALNSTNILPQQQQQVPYHAQQAMPQYQHSPQYRYSPPQSQHQHPMYHQHVQQQQQILMQQQQQQQYLHNVQHNNSSGNVPITANNVNNNVANTSLDNGERFYQNLSIYRNQEIPNGYISSDNVSNSGTLNGGKMLSPQYERSPSNHPLQRNFPGSQTSLQQIQPNRQSNEFVSPPLLKERPTSAYLQKENYPPPATGMSGRSYSTRDMIRQEAKLQEIGEEVRRREIREKINLQPEQYYNANSPSRIRPPINSPGQYAPHLQQPKPQANIPNCYSGEAGQFSSTSYSNNSNNQSSTLKQPMRPALPEEIGYRESPPPPPPPPTSTHPLYQPNQRSPDNRYTASVGEPPRGGYYPSSPVTSSSSSRHYPLQGTNPWEREEREKEAELRREAAKEWRDQQIMELLALGPNRNQSQEEQLRALKLEKEFERRVQEDDEDEEDDPETIERVQDVMRTAQEQDRMFNSTNTLNKSSSSNSSRVSANNSGYSHMNGATINRSGISTNIALEEKERLRRLKEMKMRQAELDSLKAEEKRAKHKEEDLRFYQNNLNHSSNTPKPAVARPSHLRLDNLLNSSTTAYSNSNISSNLSASSSMNNTSLVTDHNSSMNSSLNQAPQQRLDSLLEQTLPPPPPERIASFANISHTLRNPPASVATSPSSTQNSISKNDFSPQSHTNTLGPKKVSFQDSTTTSIANSTNSTSLHDTKVHHEDPNRFISEAETMLASPKSPDTPFLNSTPGVIGTQEVYRDPRQKRLAEQQQKSLTNKLATVPEKLSFHEKMQMFAMETGEEGTPKSKVKISRAQRDIDNLSSAAGTVNTSTNSNNNNGACVTNSVSNG